MPKRSKTHMLMRRQQILDAASRVFADKGIHQTSMRDICVESGLSMGALYNHFPSKRELIFSYAKKGIETQETMAFETLEEMQAHFIGLLQNDSSEFLEDVTIEIQIFEESLRDELVRSIATEAIESTIRNITQVTLRLQEMGEVRTDMDIDIFAHKLAALMVSLLLFRLLGFGLDKQELVACMADEFSHLQVEKTN